PALSRSVLLLISRQMSDASQLLSEAARRIPPLSAGSHKGQAGRLCVVGGCREYTGAPYFAAAAALRVGADLAHVICAEAAAPVIKSYSPELIVHPVLDGESASRELELWLPRFHAVLVGPGLGRGECVAGAEAAIKLAVSLNKPLVIDADGLAVVCSRPHLISGASRVLLTPNIVELRRLRSALCDGDSPDTDEAAESTARRISRSLGGGVALLCKGPVDVAVIDNDDGNAAASSTLTCSVVGSPRRCGGQGDVLAGLALAFANWCYAGPASPASPHPALLAAFAASALTRRCSAAAFKVNRRAMLASDLLAQIGPCSRELFPEADAVSD
ncbi:hypothetical protein BOX15_Mlig026390g2, partial [Macrostomum lignano]